MCLIDSVYFMLYLGNCFGGEDLMDGSIEFVLKNGFGVVCVWIYGELEL